MSPYIDGSYFTGDKAPVSILGTPFTAVIDLETMMVINKDVQSEGYGMSVDEILDAVHEANEN